MIKANQLLVNFYGKAYQTYGRPEAVKRLKDVIARGVRILVEMPDTRSSQSAKLIMAQVRNGRDQELVESVAADVQDTYKDQKGGYLTKLSLGSQGSLSFLPDVEIPATEENRSRWRRFLEKLDPRHRRGLDPETGLSDRIPYREGVWYGSMVFQTGVPPELLPEIVEIRGNFSAFAARSGVDVRIRVDGHLFASEAFLMAAEPFLEFLGGDLHVYGEERRRIKFASHLQLSPERLIAWGLEGEKRLVVGDSARYRLTVGEHDGVRTQVLAEVRETGMVFGSGGGNYYWDGGSWKEMRGELPMETANAVRVKLGKVAVSLGLGKAFLTDHTDANLDNARKLLTFLEVCQGRYSPGVEIPLAEAQKEILEGVSHRLERIARLTDLDGSESGMEIEKRSSEIMGLLEAISQDDLRTVQAALSQAAPPFDLKLVRQDTKYLQGLVGDVSADEVLVSGGRAVVYLNNVFISKEAKGLVASRIAHLLEGLRDVVGKEEAQRRIVELLKRPDTEALRRLKETAPDKKDELARFAADLADLDRLKPSDIFQDIQHAQFSTDSDELTHDRAFVHKILKFGRGPLNEMFQWVTEEGGGFYDLDKLLKALNVNLRSFMAAELRTMLGKLKGRLPADVIRLLAEQLTVLEPILKAYNAAVAASVGRPTQEAAGGE